MDNVVTLVASVVISMLGTLVLTAVYLYLSGRDREPFLRVWAYSWVIYSLRFPFKVAAILHAPAEPYLEVVGQSFTLVAGLFLLYGTYLFLRRPVRRLWAYGGVVAGAWLLVMSLAGTPLRIITWPTYAFLSLIYVTTGWAFLSNRGISGAGKLLSGWSFILWGVYKVALPYVETQASWLSPAAYELGATFGMVVALGVLLTYFQKAQTQLEQGEERYRLLADNARDVVYRYRLRPNPGFEYISPSCSTLTGYAPLEFYADPQLPLKLVYPDDAERFRALWPTRHWLERPVQLRLVARDGRVRWTEQQNMPLRDAAGRITGVVGMLRDITERHQAEDLFRTLVEQSLAGIYMIQDGRFLYVNPKLADIFGYTQEEIAQGLPVDALVAPAHRERVRANIRRRLDGEVVSVHYGFNGLRKDGAEIQVEVQGNLAEYNGQPAILGTLLDVTEKRRAEEKQRQLEAQIQHAQKLESLGVLAGGIAHDFNNLLMGILGNAGLALLELPEDASARRHILQLERAAQRAAELTSQMLAYSGRGQFVVSTVHLSRVATEMLSLLETVISKNAQLDLHLAEQLPPIRADATQLRQVIMNLITNASDALEDRPGVITLTTGRIELPGAASLGEFSTGELEPGPYVFLEVVDTGKGMDADTLSRIFDPFFTTKFTGRGLGLAAVLGIIRGHRGAIGVESAPGRGTTFRVFFPCAEAVPAETAAENDNRLPFAANGVVLVVDDESQVRDVARQALEKAGMVVLCAENGREGVELFRQHIEDVSVVLLDMTMPEMDGEATFRELRRMSGDVRVILSSGYDEREATRRFQDGQLSGFLQKPYGPRDLVKKVWQVLWH